MATQGSSKKTDLATMKATTEEKTQLKQEKRANTEVIQRLTFPRTLPNHPVDKELNKHASTT